MPRDYPNNEGDLNAPPPIHERAEAQRAAERSKVRAVALTQILGAQRRYQAAHCGTVCVAPHVALQEALLLRDLLHTYIALDSDL